MDKQIKHWIVVLERIKTELLWMPLDHELSVKRIKELVKEMEEAVEQEV